jgi:hypothetical protein
LSLVGALDFWGKDLGRARPSEEVLIDTAGSNLAAGNSSIRNLIEWLACEVSAGSLESVGKCLAIGHRSSGNVRVAYILGCGRSTSTAPAWLNGALGRATIAVLGVSVIALVEAKVKSISTYLFANAVAFI